MAMATATTLTPADSTDVKGIWEKINQVILFCRNGFY
jgi:hypothetical protein